MSEATGYVAALAPTGLGRSRASYTIQHGLGAGQFSTSLAAAVGTDQGSSSTRTQHTVERGDNLSRIARDFLRSQGLRPSNRQIYNAVRVVAESNGIKDADLIFPGQQVDLGALSVQMVGADVATSQRVVQTASDSVDARSVRAGSVAHSRMTISAPPQDSSVRLSSSVARNTGDVVVNAIRILSPGRGSRWAGTLDGPARLSSSFGTRRDPFTGQHKFHDGIDLAAGVGTEIRPFQAGVVTFSGTQSGYGNVVKVLHPNGLESTYGHNSLNLVRTGDTVDETTPLGWVGSTGRATGPHLHFEIRRDGKAVNPVPYLSGSV